MSGHLTPAELEALVSGNLQATDFRTIARHLLRGCASCHALLAPFYQHLLTSLPIEPSQANSVGSDALLDRALTAFRSYRRYLRREEVQQRKVATLLECGGGREALTNQTEVPLRGLGVLKALLDRSWAVRYVNLEEMRGLARLAVDVASRLDPRWHDERDVADWQARAWGEWGNALRVSDDLDEAERAFGIAFEFLQHGNKEVSLKARLHDLYASYLGTRRKFDLAFTSLDIVYSTYLELGDSHLAGKALSAKAMYLHYNCCSEDAITVNLQAMSLIEKARDKSIMLFAIHNHIRFLIACGHFAEAQKKLLKHLGELRELEGRIYQLRLRWVQAQISAGLGKWESAEQGLQYVKDGFEQEGMVFHAALASLELALVWMRQSRYEEAEKMVLPICDVFIVLRIHREAFGTIMVLKEAFERRIATIGLLEEAVDFLERGYYASPGERFTPK